MKKLLLAIITIILIVTLSIFYLVMGLQQSLLQQNYYESLLTETNVVSQFHEQLREELPNMMQEEDEEVSEEQLEIINLILDVYDEEWLKETVLEFTDQALKVVNQEQTELIITIDIHERRDQLKEAMVDHFLEKSDDELAELDINRDEVAEKTDEILTEMEFFEEPITIDLSEETEISEFIDQKDFFTQTFYLGFIGSLVLLLLMTFLIIKKAVIKYFGLTLTLHSLFFIISIIAVKNVVIPSISSEIANEFLSPAMVEDLINVTLNQFLLVPIIALIIGLILTIVGYKIAPKKDPDEPDFDRPDEKVTEKLNKIYEQKMEKEYQQVKKEKAEQEEKPAEQKEKPTKQKEKPAKKENN